ncbi:hypothetical protein ACWGIE_06715 [Pseudomonas fulva]
MREWICAGALLILAGCGAGDSDPKTASGSSGIIDEWILADYPDNSIVIGSDKSDPSYGKLRDVIPRVNKEKNEAAHLVAAKCKHVVNVLFLRRESTIEELKFIVDCEGGERYELTSSDLAKGGGVKSNSDKSIGRPEAIQRCKNLVSGKRLTDRSLSFHELSDSSYYKAPNGNVRLVLGFDEESIDGAKKNWRAACTFDTAWKGDVTINPN